jgi:hypothetical protein
MQLDVPLRLQLLASVGCRKGIGGNANLLLWLWFAGAWGLRRKERADLENCQEEKD